MYKRDNELLYSPSDLNAFLENESVTWLDRFNVEYPGELNADEPEEEDELIRRTGDEHEQLFLTGLVSSGSDTVVIDRNDPAAFAGTLHAMQQGREIIYQARLQHGEFAGWADFLFRVDGPSALGTWHYEVWDTKLARSLKPYFAIQLCCYAEMLNSIQGRLSDKVGIILGNGERRPLRVLDYWYYYRAIKRSFLDQQRGFDRSHPPAFPGLADYRHWTGYVSRMLEARDDVAQVANIRTSQIGKLAVAGIMTMDGVLAVMVGSPALERTRCSNLDQMRAVNVYCRAMEAGASHAVDVVKHDYWPKHDSFRARSA